MTIKAEPDEVIGRKGVSAARRNCLSLGIRSIRSRPGDVLMLIATQERGVFLVPTTQAILIAEVSAALHVREIHPQAQPSARVINARKGSRVAVSLLLTDPT
jgi:hypothetical protein